MVGGGEPFFCSESLMDQPKTADQNAKEYFGFVKNLADELINLQIETGLLAIRLVYSWQLGQEAGNESEFLAGAEEWFQILGAKINRINLDAVFDRSIGHLEYIGEVNPQILKSINMFSNIVCYKTYIFRNEFCGEQLGDVLRDPIVEEQISKDGYSSLASKFNNVLSSSGFVIWHVCREEKIDEEYALTDMELGTENIPSNTFLHVLGSSPENEDVDMPIGDGIAAYTLRSGRPLRLDNLLDGDEVARKTNGGQIKHPGVVLRNKWRSGVFQPLINQNKVVGVIAAYSPRQGGFNNLDEMIVTRCAEQIAAYFVVHRAQQRNFQLQQRIRSAGIELATAQYSIYGSVHDAINTSAKLMNNIELIKPTRETATFFDTAVDHATRVNDVLGKLRSNIRSPGKIPIKASRVNLRSFLADKLNALSVDAHTSGVKLLNKVPSNIDMDTDKFRLSQCAFNIVSNAIFHFRHTTRHPKEIIIQASIISEGDTVKLVIEDNGPGINPDYLPDKIFEPFVSYSGGMGLGLAIVQTFVNDMHGSVSVKSEWGERKRIHTHATSRA